MEPNYGNISTKVKDAYNTATYKEHIKELIQYYTDYLDEL